MAGSDVRLLSPAGGPAIILVEPQLGENIGFVARAMLNCGLDDLRLVQPRDGWPSQKARSAAAGADVVLDRAGLFETVEAAIGDLHQVFAATARSRDMVKPVVTPNAAVAAMQRMMAGGGRCGVMFGPERSGLTNDHVALAGAALTFPLNPGFSSLNLSQAVLLVGWEWFKATLAPQPDVVVPSASPPASRQDLLHFFDHLEGALDRGGFFFPPEKRAHMLRNLRNLFHRTELTDQDVRTLHGVVTCLERLPPED